MKKEFVESLNVPEAKENQKKVAMEHIKSIAFRKMSKFDFNNGNRLNLNKLAEEVAKQCNVDDTSRIANLIEYWLTAEDYIVKIDRQISYKLKRDESGDYEAEVVTDIIKRPSEQYNLQVRWQNEQNQQANQTLSDYVSKVQTIIASLPVESRKDEKAIKSKFTEQDLEKNKIWIELAVQKAIKLETMMDSSNLTEIDVFL